MTKAGKPKLPVALTEYNIFATGSNQPVSHVNGMHAVLVTGEVMKTGYVAACRWDLANGWDSGNDHGMYSYNEPDIPQYTPHPAFYHLYYLQKFTGDVLLNSSIIGDQGIVIIPTAFSSGHVAAAVVNTDKLQKIVRLNIANFKFGDRYYTYTLTGTPGEDFSRKVFVNGSGPSLAAGGPADYETIKASSSIIGDEVVIKAPPLSSTYILVEPGTKELTVNNTTAVKDFPFRDDIDLYPNPSDGTFTLKNIPQSTCSIEIRDIFGRSVYLKNKGIEKPLENFDLNITTGIYFITLSDNFSRITKKLIIK